MPRRRVHVNGAERSRAYRDRRRRGPLDRDDWALMGAVLAHLALMHPQVREDVEFVLLRLEALAKFFRIDLTHG